jgi:hypothetical protein
MGFGVPESNRADRIARLVLAALLVAAVFYLNWRYVLVHFSNGGDLLDSGVYSWVMASGDPWLTAPRATYDVGGLSYFYLHFMPLMSVLSVTFHALGIDRFAAYSLYAGASFALLAAGLCAAVLSTWTGGKSAVLLAVVVLLTLLSDVILQIASFPHPEIAIIAFCTLGAALWQSGHRRLAILPFVLACAVREDGGLYAAAFLFGLAALGPLTRKALLAPALLGVAAAMTSAVIFWAKAALFPGYSVFSSDFAGNHWAHLTPTFLSTRLLALLTNIQALTSIVPAVILAFVACRYLLFAVLMAPLIILQFVALRDQLGTFTLYYATPFLVIWIGMLLVAGVRARAGQLRTIEPVILLAFALLGSAPLVFIVHPPGSLPVATTALVAPVVDLPHLAQEAADATVGVPGVCVSTGVAALIPDNFAPAQVVDPASDLAKCRTIFVFNHDLHYDALKPKLAAWTAGPVIGDRIERYDQRP